MNTICPIDEQFEKETVQQIREIQSRLRQYPVPDGAGRLYAHEIDVALESGLLLASLELASTLLEILVRDLLIHFLAVEFNIGDLSDDEAINVLEMGLEGSEDPEFFSFRGIINRLYEYEVIDKPMHYDLGSFYSSIRIPLLHGLSRRYLRGKRVDPLSAASALALDEVLYLSD